METVEVAEVESPHPTAAVSHAELSRPAQLLLGRLLIVGARAPTPAALIKDLSAVLPEPLSAEGLGRLREELLALGYIDPKVLRLSAAGRAAGLEMFSLKELPPKTTWKQWVANYIFPIASGLTREELATGGKALALLLVKRHFGLAESGASTAAQLLDTLAFKKLGLPDGSDDKALRATGLSKILGSQSPLGPADVLNHVRSDKVADLRKLIDAIVCHAMGFPSLADAKALKAAVLSEMIGSDRVLPAAEIQTQLPRVVLRIPNDKPETVRTALIQRWIRGESSPAVQKAASSPSTHSAEPAPSPAPQTMHFDLAAFVAIIKQLAQTSPLSARFGDNKLFIHYAWHLYQQTPGGQGVSFATFQNHLLQASRAGLLQLSRADLVAAMNPEDVRASETRSGSAEFHFIYIEGTKP